MPLKLNGSTSGFVALDAPAAAGSNTLVLPTGNGSNGQVLTTNGSGTLSWSTVTSSQWTTSGSNIYYTTGSVGVNNTSPGAKFHVIGGTTAGSVDTAAIFTGGSGTVGSGARIYLSGTPGFETTRGAYIEGVHDTATNAHSLRFATNASTADPVERMRITNNGFLKATTDGAYTGIDTNSHGVRQTVSASWMWMAINNTASPYGLRVEYTGASPNGTDNPFLYCYDSTALRASIRSNGGLANFSGNNVNLSDINSKKDISPAADTWDCIKEWEIVNYRYKDQPNDADLNLGVIAQQVAESCPEVITVFQEAKEATETEPAQEERLGVKEQQMMWMAIKALQEAQARIETLEANNAALEARLSALEVTP